MVDIVEGDILVVGGREYPVKAAAEWSGFASTSSFQRMAATAATTKRSVTSGGKRSAASAHLTGLTITPLDPVSAELAASSGLDTPHELKQCYLSDGTGYLHLIVEDLKR